MKIEYLTKYDFLLNAEKNKCKNWSKEHLNGRWTYHQEAIDILKGIKFNKILELGTLGATLTNISDTLDYDGPKAMSVWPKIKNITFNHNLLSIPWPIKNKQYDIIVALRVFQHLDPNQKECFLEAKRISKYLILALPKKDDLLIYTEINPNKKIECGFNTILYFWKF